MTRPRSSPTEQTNAETNYLIKQMESKTPMVVKLLDGEEIRGWIEYYDRHCIKINRERPPNYFIRKEQILYMYKDPARGRRREG
jgi:small nuclear ribonucleoprotein (snRNP)-like protein